MKETDAAPDGLIPELATCKVQSAESGCISPAEAAVRTTLETLDLFYNRAIELHGRCLDGSITPAERREAVEIQGRLKSTVRDLDKFLQ